jgi:hypothetical protein
MSFLGTAKSCKEYYTSAPISIKDLCDKIQQGTFGLKERIENLRYLRSIGESKKQLNQLKTTLPIVFPSVTLGAQERKTNLGTLNGWIHFDIDNIKDIIKDDVKNELWGIEEVAIVFKSPSGNGLKILCPIDLNGETKKNLKLFSAYWDFLSEKINKQISKFELVVDPAPKSVKSTFFISYDPEIWVRDGKITKLTENDLKASSKKTVQSKSHIKIKKNQSKVIEAPIARNEIEGLLYDQIEKEYILGICDKYLKTPKGIGIRNQIFFTTCLQIAQHIPIESDRFKNIISFLDYDNSRDIPSVFKSISKYSSSSNNSSKKRRKQIDAINAAIDKHLLVNQHVSEVENSIGIGISENKVTILSAPTGAGKTHFCLNSLANIHNGQIWIAVPLTSILDQLKTRYHTRSDIQFLEKGDYPSDTVKIILCTYEKMILSKKYIAENTLIVIDEWHLQAASFREGTHSQIINMIDDDDFKFLLISATAQESAYILKQWSTQKIHHIKIKVQNQTKRHLNIIKARDSKSAVVIRIEEILKKQPNAKIMVFKDDKQSLNEIGEALKTKGITTIAITSDSKQDEAVQYVFSGGTPMEQIILCTSLVEVGIELNFLTNIIMLNVRTCEQMVQIASRQRKSIEIDLIKSHQSKEIKSIVEWTNEDFFFDYKLKIDDWIKLEQKRFNMIYGVSQKSKYQKDLWLKAIEYIKASNQSIGHVETLDKMPLHHTIRSKEEKQEVLFKVSLQGVICHIVGIEHKNECNSTYFYDKLKTLFGWTIGEVELLDAKVDMPKSKKEDNIIKEMGEWHKKNGVTPDNESIEQIVRNIGLSHMQEKMIVSKLKSRLIKVKHLGITMNPNLIFLETSEWNATIFSILVEENPHLYPIETQMLKQINCNDVIFTKNLKSLLSSIRVSKDQQHILDYMMNCSEKSLVSLIKKVFICKASKRLLLGKQARCVIIENRRYEGVLQSSNLKGTHSQIYSLDNKNWDMCPSLVFEKNLNDTY